MFKWHPKKKRSAGVNKAMDSVAIDSEKPHEKSRYFDAFLYKSKNTVS